MKKWFTEKYKFEWADLTTSISIIGVMLNLWGLYMASAIVFIVNAVLSLILCFTTVKHVNIVILNIAFLALNIGVLIK